MIQMNKASGGVANAIQKAQNNNSRPILFKRLTIMAKTPFLRQNMLTAPSVKVGKCGVLVGVSPI